MSKEKDKEVADKPDKIDYSSKSVRQAAFREECKRLGLSPQEIMEKANLFQGVDVSRFKLIHMPA